MAVLSESALLSLVANQLLGDSKQVGTSFIGRVGSAVVLVVADEKQAPAPARLICLGTATAVRSSDVKQQIRLGSVVIGCAKDSVVQTTFPALKTAKPSPVSAIEPAKLWQDAVLALPATVEHSLRAPAADCLFAADAMHGVDSNEDRLPHCGGCDKSSANIVERPNCAVAAARIACCPTSSAPSKLLVLADHNDKLALQISCLLDCAPTGRLPELVVCGIDSYLDSHAAATKPVWTPFAAAAAAIAVARIIERAFPLRSEPGSFAALALASPLDYRTTAREC